MTQPSRSPIKDKPLRHAGQSLEAERDAILSDKFEPIAMVAVFMVVLAALEWWRELTNAKPQAMLASVAAVIAVGLAARQFFKLRPRLKALRLGIEGEKVVGQFLERLRLQGYDVFHDILAPGFNIDHVLIGPAGVFTVETKTWSKPPRGDARISFDGEQLLADGLAPDRDPIVQAHAQAAWLRNILTQSTGRRFDVMPLLLFPGWFVEQTPGSRGDIWLLEPKALPAFLQHEAPRMEASDAKLVAFHLSRFIRSVERERAV